MGIELIGSFNLYNPDLKREYLNQSGYHDPLKPFYIFKALTRCEEEYQKDLYEFSSDEMREALLSFQTINLQELRHHLSVIYNYTKWAADKELRDPLSKLETVNVRDVNLKELMMKTIIKSPEHLFDILSQAYDLKQIENDVIVIILLWLGVDSSDVRLIKVNDFESDFTVFKYKGSVINVPDKLPTILYNYNIQPTFEKYIPQRQLTRTFYKSESPYLLKNTVNINDLHIYQDKPMTQNRIFGIYKDIKDVQYKNGCSYTSFSISLSGEFYLIRETQAQIERFDIKKHFKKAYPHWRPEKTHDYMCLYKWYEKFYKKNYFQY